MRDDPSFILRSEAAKDLVGLARDLQELVNARASAAAQPLSLPEADVFGEDAAPPPGHRAGAGSASILPYLKQSLVSNSLDGRHMPMADR